MTYRQAIIALNGSYKKPDALAVFVIAKGKRLVMMKINGQLLVRWESLRNRKRSRWAEPTDWVRGLKGWLPLGGES